MKDNEKVYDEKIFPLMRQIIEICKKHGIPLLATFQIGPPDEDGTPLCTTYVPVEDQDSVITKLHRVARDGWDVHSPIALSFIASYKE